MIFIHQFLVPNVNLTRARYIKAGLNFFNSFNQHYLHMILQTGSSKVTYRPLGQLFKITTRSAAKFYLITGSLDRPILSTKHPSLCSECFEGKTGNPW